MRPVPWYRRIAALAGLGVRRALWAEAIRSEPPQNTARNLDAAVCAAARREPAGLAAVLALLDLDDLSRRAGPGRLAQVLDAARRLELDGAMFLLEFPGRPLRSGELGPPPDPAVEAHTLGLRKTAARGVRTPLLERLLTDPDPRVVRELLRNPRLREAEVVTLASRRPARQAVFGHLARAEAWIVRPAVQRAVVRNPFAPPRLVRTLLLGQPGPLLEEVAQDKGLHPAVRDGALRILAWRREGDQA